MNSPRARMWKVMRAVRRFTAAELAVTASCTSKQVREYTGRLYACGYIRFACKVSTGGKKHRETVYLLVRDTGPDHPRIRPSVYDPNQKKYFCAGERNDVD